METAISIAYSCHLFTPNMRYVELRESELGPQADDNAIQQVSRPGQQHQSPRGAQAHGKRSSSPPRALPSLLCVCLRVQCLFEKLKAVHELNKAMNTLPGHTNVGIVIEGGVLNGALAPNNQATLMALCKECKAVVCCRVTPMQKAQVRHRLASPARGPRSV